MNNSVENSPQRPCQVDLIWTEHRSRGVHELLKKATGRTCHGPGDCPAEYLFGLTDEEHIERAKARAKASFVADTTSREGAEHYVRAWLGDGAVGVDVAAVVEDLHAERGSWDLRDCPAADLYLAVKAHTNGTVA